jgi:hypothetical protein
MCGLLAVCSAARSDEYSSTRQQLEESGNSSRGRVRQAAVAAGQFLRRLRAGEHREEALPTNLRIAWWCQSVVDRISALIQAGVGLLPGDASDDRACRILTYWDRQIRLAAVTNNQAMTAPPYLAGRMYFFSKEYRLLTPRGRLIVDWYDMSGAPDAEQSLLGKCEFDADSLQKLKSVNLVGMGYTIWVPWPDYRPQYTRVKIQVTFMPASGGDPVFAEPYVMSLQADFLGHGCERNAPD